MKLQQRSHATLKSKLQDHKTIVELWGKKMSHRVMCFVRQNAVTQRNFMIGVTEG